MTAQSNHKNRRQSTEVVKELAKMRKTSLLNLVLFLVLASTLLLSGCDILPAFGGAVPGDPPQTQEPAAPLPSPVFAREAALAYIRAQHPDAAPALDLTWSDSNSDESGFEVYRCLGSGCTIDTSFDTPVAVLGAPSGSIFSLKMDESSWTSGSPDVLDSSGNGNHGTSYNEASRGVFDGDDDYVDLGDIDELDTAGAFSIELRFRRDGETGLATNHNINNLVGSYYTS